jgi:hypothetical protein
MVIQDLRGQRVLKVKLESMVKMVPMVKTAKTVSTVILQFTRFKLLI